MDLRPSSQEARAEQYLRNSILLIEDNPDAVALTRRTLQKVDASIQLIVTDNPDEAMDAFLGIGKCARENTRLPFLVFFDLRIGKGSGLALLQRFCQDPVTSEAALVVLSASSSREEAQGLMGGNLPADDFVAKPISTAKMAELIERFWPE